jgi:hypothetical protein
MILLPKFPKDDDHDYNPEIDELIEMELFGNDKPKEEPEELGLDSWPYVEE